MWDLFVLMLMVLLLRVDVFFVIIVVLVLVVGFLNSGLWIKLMMGFDV